MFIFSFISIVFNSFHFSLEAAEPVYVALGVIAVMIVTIVLFCAEGFKEGLSLRGMVLLRESGIKELAICFFIFIACVPFLSHPKEPEVKTYSGALMTMSSDTGVSISSNNISNVSTDEESESGWFAWFDNCLLLFGIIGFSGWTGWSFWKLIEALHKQKEFEKCLLKLINKVITEKKSDDRRYTDIKQIFEDEFLQSIENRKLVDLRVYINFFTTVFKDLKDKKDEIKNWVSYPLLQGLKIAINENNDRYFRILLNTAQDIFKEHQYLITHYPRCLYEEAEKERREWLLECLSDAPLITLYIPGEKSPVYEDSLLYLVFNSKISAPKDSQIKNAVVKEAVAFLITIASDLIIDDEVAKFKKIYDRIKESLFHPDEKHSPEFYIFVLGFLLSTELVTEVRIKEVEGSPQCFEKGSDNLLWCQIFSGDLSTLMGHKKTLNEKDFLSRFEKVYCSPQSSCTGWFM